MDTDTSDGLSIAEVVERTGLSAHTLRYYERIGAIDRPERSLNGHRRYTRDDVVWLGVLTCLRETGMSISDMCHYADLARQGPPTAGQRKELLVRHREAVVARIQRLQDDLALIDEKVDAYEHMEREQQPGTTEVV